MLLTSLGLFALSLVMATWTVLVINGTIFDFIVEKTGGFLPSDETTYTVLRSHWSNALVYSIGGNAVQRLEDIEYRHIGQFFWLFFRTYLMLVAASFLTLIFFYRFVNMYILWAFDQPIPREAYVIEIEGAHMCVDTSLI